MEFSLLPSELCHRDPGIFLVTMAHHNFKTTVYLTTEFIPWWQGETEAENDLVIQGYEYQSREWNPIFNAGFLKSKAKLTSMGPAFLKIAPDASSVFRPLTSVQALRAKGLGKSV